MYIEILWKRREIAPREQFVLLYTIFSYMMLDFYVKTRIRFSLRDKRLFEISEVEITRVECSSKLLLNKRSLEICYERMPAGDSGGLTSRAFTMLC